MSKAKLELTVQQSEPWPGLPTKRDIRRWILASLLEDANVTVRLIDEDETILNESITFPSPQLPDFEEGVEEELKKEYKLGAVSSVSFSAGKGSEKLLKDGTTSRTKMEAAKPKKRCRCNKDEKQIIELQLGVKKSKIKA